MPHRVPKLALADALTQGRTGPMRSAHHLFFALLFGCAALGCDGADATPTPPPEDHDAEPTPVPPPPAPRERVDSRPPPMARPVPLWEGGKSEREIDAATADVNGYFLLDLGEAWTPYLFTERGNEAEERVPHSYRETYLALARGEHPDNHHGARASRDKYLELYGIMPTLGLLRERFRAVKTLECTDSLDLSALDTFGGFLAYRNNTHARQRASAFAVLERRVASMVEAQAVASEAELDEDALESREAGWLRDFRAQRPEVEAIRAAQARLECEGYFAGKGAYTRGALDWATHEALAEFERRHRVYGWGFIGGETLERLQEAPLELERRAVLRVLTERAMLALGVIEDGSASSEEAPRTYRGLDQRERPVPNLEADLWARIERDLGLETPASTLDFLEGLGELGPESERVIALGAPELPEYYAGDMDIRIELDRGDVWYEFPYDDEGKERAQPMERRPHLNVYVEYEGQRIALARYGTTIGGWRTEEIDGRTWWRYKNSPTGERIWHTIASAPVWLPPHSTPARSLLERVPGKSGAEGYRVDYHEMGPSYASAYGLVAAYHRQFTRDANGNFVVGGDEAIRSHGSVDYMSIMRRHSHGCHRLHNHIAVRLMSWVLAHRPHRRIGQSEIGYRRNIAYGGHNYHVAIDHGGYVFQLEEPLVIDVLEGRIRGSRTTPIEAPLPRYDAEVGAYLLPDGGAVRIDRLGEMTPYTLPDAGPPDGGWPDAGLVDIPSADSADVPPLDRLDAGVP